MQIFYIQIIITALAFIILNSLRYDLRYICIFLLPMQSMGIFHFTFGTALILPMQLAFVVLFLSSTKQLKADKLIAVFVMFLPFIISLLINIFFFTPFVGWELEGSARETWSPMMMKYSLSFSNFTQHLYIIYSLGLFLLFSSISLDKRSVQKIIDWSIWFVIFVGMVQFVSYYIGLYEVYRFLFYSITRLGMDRQTLGAWKRINATFIEPSYFGLYASFTLMFYLALFDSEKLIKSWAARTLFVVGFMSTSGSFYAGVIVFIGIFYLFYSTGKTKVLLYILMLLLSPVFVFYVLDFILAYVDEKTNSTNIRTTISWDHAWNAIELAPYWGHAYGSTKSFIVITQMLAAIGLVGTAIFSIGLSLILKNKDSRLFVLGIILTGLGNFELTLPQIWVYLGLLCNPSLISSNSTVRQANYHTT